jgi:hypothetical protein
MQQIIIPQKDKGYAIAFTVEYANATPRDLSGYTVNMKAWSPTIPGTLIVNNTCTPVNASAGTCTYTIASGDFNTVGLYYGELELTAAGIQESTETFKIIVGESG